MFVLPTLRNTLSLLSTPFRTPFRTSLPSALPSSLPSPSSPASSALLALKAVQALRGRGFSTTFSALDQKKKKDYKLKTHQGAKKRWKALPNGHFKHWRPGKTHHNSKYSRIRLHNLGLPSYETPAQRKQLKKLLPYA